MHGFVGVSGGNSGTGAKTPKSATSYTGTAKQNKRQNSSKGNSSYQSSGKQVPSKNNGYKTNAGAKGLTGSRQKRGSVLAAAKIIKKTGTVQKSSGTRTFAKACSVPENAGVKNASKVPNKVVRTGMVLEGAIATAPEWGPAAVEVGKIVVEGIVGLGAAVLGDWLGNTIGGFVASKSGDGEEKVQPEGEVSEENEINSAEKDRKQGRPRKKHKVVENQVRLPARDEPNSSADLLNPDKSVKQRRYYGPDGRAQQDIDFNHTDDGTHTFPHIHNWDWSKIPPRQK